jgi:ornithine carbamoyltransferase
MKKDFLTLLDYTGDEISELINLSAIVKKERLDGVRRKDLDGKTAVLIFDKPSLRTKLTFETAIFELGGNALGMAATNGRLGERESVSDMAHNLERWIHLLVVRTFEHETLKEFASYCSVPVINALTDAFHPCQSIALGLTVQEKFEGKKVKIAYLGDGNNVCVSHMLYAAKTGHSFVVATPKGYEPPVEFVKIAKEEASKHGATVEILNSPEDAVRNADLVYTDVWASMGQEDEADSRNSIFASFQVNEKLMLNAPSTALFTHCLPAHRGSEVTDGVIDSAQSIVFDEAENRLHAHKAIISYLMRGQGK